ncbi:MAG TPA: hypothetical protein VLB86_03215 [Gaiellaceae bacterium]|nr:hypothetical protein [Gaiellaceae bacterium]
MNDAGWLLITTAVSLVAGAVAGWVSSWHARREARRERVREEVLRWANPIRNAVRGLESRLGNILELDLYKALSARSAGVDRAVHPEWAVSYEYVMPSTLFLFAEYFAWVQLLREWLSLELFESERSHQSFVAATWKVTDALGHWPLEPDTGEEDDTGEGKLVLAGIDAQVFALQQRAIGELVIERDREPPRVLTYRAFLDSLDSDRRFASLIEPLRSLLESLEPGTKRWRRLERTNIALKELESECRALLRLDGESTRIAAGAEPR